MVSSKFSKGKPGVRPRFSVRAGVTGAWGDIEHKYVECSTMGGMQFLS
jgi:hypothetical protein